MPNLLDIRRRIRSVTNTRQITQAMKMVSAAKLRRSQERALASRPYAQRLAELIGGLARHLDVQDLAGARLPGENWTIDALFARREVKARLLLVVGTDSGLVGAFNANVTKAALAHLTPGAQTRVIAVGRKMRDFFKRHGFPLAGERVGIFAKTVDARVAEELALQVMRAYASAEVDEVLLVGNEFKSAIQQTVAVHRLLPLELPEAESQAESRSYLYETPPATLLAHLLPRALESQIYRALLESVASEHAARMNAMEAASNNAADLIDALTLNLNRVRQAAITKEIIEIVGGAAALS